MEPEYPGEKPAAASKAGAMVWAGRVISALIVLFIGGMGLVMHFTKPAEMQEGLIKMGYPATVGQPLFWIEMACVLLYAIPQTAVLGAVLLTGYLGGAVATHVRVSDPNWHFAFAMGVLVWLGLVLRDARLRRLLPFRSMPAS